MVQALSWVSVHCEQCSDIPQTPGVPARYLTEATALEMAMAAGWLAAPDGRLVCSACAVNAITHHWAGLVLGGTRTGESSPGESSPGALSPAVVAAYRCVCGANSGSSPLCPNFPDCLMVDGGRAAGATRDLSARSPVMGAPGGGTDC